MPCLSFMDNIEVRLPLPPQDKDYHTTTRRKPLWTQKWEEQVKLVWKNMPGCPVTEYCDITIYVVTLKSCVLSFATGMFFIMQQTQAVATAGNIKHVRFVYCNTKKPAQEQLIVQIVPHVLEDYPLTEHGKKRTSREDKKQQDDDRSGVLGQDSEPSETPEPSLVEAPEGSQGGCPQTEPKQE